MALDHDAYEHAMHPNKETNPNYRPQSLQKTGNCAAHSMLAALNFLIQGPEDGSKYKAIKGTMMASLGLPPRVRPVVAEPVEVTITRREIEKLKGQSDETYIGFLADKFSGANKVPNAVTIGAFRTLPETVKAKLKASGFEWAKRYI
jgi:hypothetical protein